MTRLTCQRLSPLFFLLLLFLLVLSGSRLTLDSAVAQVLEVIVATNTQTEPGVGPAVLPALNRDALFQSWRQRQQQDLPFSATPRAATARTLYVDAAVSEGGDGSSAHPFRTIQAAIDAAESGDVVVVRPGLYESDRLAMKDGVSVIGEATGEPEQVLIRGTGYEAITCAHKSVLQDVSVEAAQWSTGGVVSCYYAAPLFNRVIISQTNRLAIDVNYTQGGAILANSYVSSVEFSGEFQMQGNFIANGAKVANGDPGATGAFVVDANIIIGDLDVESTQPEVRGNRVTNNWVINGDNGIRHGGAGSVLFANNTRLGGTRGFLVHGDVRVVNNIIGYVEVGVVGFNDFPLENVQNNLFWQTSRNADNLPNPVGQYGNLRGDPRFVNLNGSNFHITRHSAALDRGRVEEEVRTDFDFETRPCDGDSNGSFIHDIGADEYSDAPCLAPTATPTPTMTPTPTVTGTLPPTPTPTPTATRPIDACQQLIEHPQFWYGASAWQKVGEASIGITAYGDWVSEPEIGIVPLHAGQIGPSALLQAVTLPVEGNAYLQVHTKLRPTNFADTGALQTAQIQIRSADSTLLSTLNQFSTAHDWTQRIYDLTPHAGQTVQVWFGGTATTEATATTFQVDDAHLYACPEPLSASALYLPLVSVQMPTPTPTPTPTFTPTPESGTPVSAPDALQLGVLSVAQQAQHDWYVTTDGHVVSATGGPAEPFPLDLSIKVRSLSSSSDGILAATAQGIYRRDRTFRWQQITDVSAHLVSARFGAIWIAPDSNPDQIWVSTDGGNTWQDDSAGLEGAVVSAVQANTVGQQVLTLRGGRYVLWERTPGTFPWKEIATVPGPAVAYEPGGVYASLVYAFLSTGQETRVGSADGNLYRFVWEGDTRRWETMHSFGERVFPLLLDLGRVSVIDLTSGAVQSYQVQGTLDQGEWTPWAVYSPTLATGAVTLPNGDVAQHIYGQPSPYQMGFAGMARSLAGALYRFDMEIEETQPGVEESVWRWRWVTSSPQRRSFIVAQAQSDEVGRLYSGADLTWAGSVCTLDDSGLADDIGFYRSDDKGLTWTQVVSDTARHPVTSLFSRPQFVLAATCDGPTVSQDGGVTWRSPADLGWPLAVGAQHLAIYQEPYNQDAVILFASGAGADSTGFLYQASLDLATGTVGTWSETTPNGLSQPRAIFVAVGSESSTPQIYLADENTVWLSPDNGTAWQSRSANLDGAQVVGFYPYVNDLIPEQGMLVATDHGLFFGPLAGTDGVWIPTKFPYTVTPVDFQGLVPASVYLNTLDGVFLLPFNFFAYLAPNG